MSRFRGTTQAARLFCTKIVIISHPAKLRIQFALIMEIATHSLAGYWRIMPASGQLMLAVRQLSLPHSVCEVTEMSAAGSDVLAAALDVDRARLRIPDLAPVQVV